MTAAHNREVGMTAGSGTFCSSNSIPRGKLAMPCKYGRYLHKHSMFLFIIRFTIMQAKTTWVEFAYLAMLFIVQPTHSVGNVD